jgi:hypothetical protein
MSLRAPKCSYPVPGLSLASGRTRIHRARAERSGCTGAEPRPAEPRGRDDEEEGLA